MDEMKIGMIGLDTSHVEAFATLLNDESNPHHLPGGRVVAAFPGGSQLCAVSRDRVAGFTEKLRDAYDLTICDSIEELCEGVDAILLHSVDGRQHLEQFRVVAEYGKPCFIDKPLACSHADAREIADLAAAKGVPLMSCSSIRYSAGVSDLCPEDASVVSCEVFGAMAILDDYPPYFWYGIHGADLVYAYMGTGCRTVRAVHTDNTDLLIGVWEDGRTANVRGLRSTPYHFGCTVFTDQGTVSALAANEPPSYAFLLQRVMPFLQGEPAAVPIEEEVEVMAFLDAAEQSLANGGQVVELPC
jgi:hypothetical protein